MNQLILLRRMSRGFLTGHSANDGWPDNTAPEFTQAVDNWNTTFNLTYLTFRRRLNEIANNSLNADVFDIYLPYHNDDVIFNLGNSSYSAYYVIPVDDDDWLHPNLYGILSPIINDCTDLHFAWNVEEQLRGSYAYNLRQPFDKKYLLSNSYCVKLPCYYPWLSRHTVYTQYLLQHGIQPNIVKQTLAFKLNHPASYYYLCKYPIDVIVDMVNQHLLGAPKFMSEMDTIFLPQYYDYIELLKELTW
jgi:hypothetical protein